MKIDDTLPCARCGMMCLSDEMTICVHYDEGEILGKFCPECTRWAIQLHTSFDGDAR